MVCLLMHWSDSQRAVHGSMVYLTPPLARKTMSYHITCPTDYVSTP
uniref:Uncharacterized protein n=1 Tax=Anguilla anguilla TaxID=7936 RepID=A0A0E9XCG4_ANGAN